MENEKEMDQLFDKLRDLLNRKLYHELRSELAELNEADAADFIEELPVEQAVIAFRALNKPQAADVFSHLPPDAQQVIVSAMSDAELGRIVEEMNLDDAVDMIEEMPANIVRRVLKNATPETRTLINQYLHYPENSVGSIMTAEFTDLRADMTVSEAIAHIRSTGDPDEMIDTCFVMDDRRVLLGAISLRNMLFAADTALIGDLMDDDVIRAETAEDREEAVQRMMHYDIISMPVVDSENRLVGIVTIDDVMDVMEEEATEDFEKMAAMLPSEKPYLKTSVFELAKNRIIWLLVLMISAMFTGGILAQYEAAFAALPLLVTFIPMITDTGVNSGRQSSTLIIRGMAVGEIDPHDDWMRVLWKELRVSLLVGVILAAFTFVRVIIQYPGNVMIAAVISLTLIFTVMSAKAIGCLLPMLAKRLHMDPALMAAPIITTIVDALSLVVYFSIAQHMLRI